MAGLNIKYSCVMAAFLLLGCPSPAEESATPEVSVEEELPTGVELFRGKGCHGCHRSSCPNLMKFSQKPLIAGKVPNTSENLRKWLKDPFSVKKGARMPNLGLTDEEIELLIEYIQTL
jgi:cytochrome c oxidase subunit 2